MDTNILSKLMNLEDVSITYLCSKPYIKFICKDINMFKHYQSRIKIFGLPYERDVLIEWMKEDEVNIDVLKELYIPNSTIFNSDHPYCKLLTGMYNLTEQFDDIKDSLCSFRTCREWNNNHPSLLQFCYRSQDMYNKYFNLLSTLKCSQSYAGFLPQPGRYNEFKPVDLNDPHIFIQ